jgi:hypothetical protein
MVAMTPEQIFELARQLSSAEQRWLSLHLQTHIAATLPEHATLSEAAELHLADPCSLRPAAKLVGITRWDVVLAAWDARQTPADLRSADEMDDLVDRLEQRGIL